jgi:uncharacterized phiE125 gp8 family phage protein
VAKLVLDTAPTEWPISVDDLKSHLKWDDAAGSDDVDTDAHLLQLIKDATELAEAEAWKVFCTQTWVEYLDAFPTVIVLTKQPVASITSVKYYDSAGDLQTLSTDVYELGFIDGRGLVRLKYSQSWPDTWDHDDAIYITYVAGVDDAAVNVADKRAVAIIATTLATHRGDTAFSLPRAASELLAANTFRGW